MKKTLVICIAVLFGCSEDQNQILEKTQTLERYFVKETPSDYSFPYKAEVDPFTGRPFNFFTNEQKNGRTSAFCVSETKVQSYECSTKTYQLRFNMCFPNATSFDWYLTYNGQSNIISYLGSTTEDNLIHSLVNRPSGNYGAAVTVTFFNSATNQTEQRDYLLNQVNISNPTCIYTQKFIGASDQGIGNGYYSGDFNGDGKTDVIQTWNNGNKMALLVYGNVTTGSYNPTYSVTTVHGANHITCIPLDMNGDGKTDLVQAWNNGGKLNMILYTSNGSSFSVGTNITTSNGAVFLKLLPVDIDGDQKVDIAQLWSNGGSLSIIIYKSNGSGFSQYWSGTTTHGAGNVGFTVGDFNADGRTDIIQLYDNQGNLSSVVHKSQGTSYELSSTTITNTVRGSSNVGFVPVYYNLDSKVDLIHAWSHNGELNVFLNTSSTTGFSEIWTSDLNQGSGNLALLPYNGSGFLQVFNSSNKTAFIGYNK